MKVKELIAELEVRNPEARVYILDEEGDKVPVEKLYRVDDRRTPKHEQDVLIMHKL